MAIQNRLAENQIERLSALAAELVRRQVAAIAGPIASALVAKAATIPIVFVAGEYSVTLGLMTSLARPGGNVTGINIFANELVAKRLELLREQVPEAARVAVLVNPANPATAETNASRGARCQHEPGDRRGAFFSRTARRILRGRRPAFRTPAITI